MVVLIVLLLMVVLIVLLLMVWVLLCGLVFALPTTASF